VVDVRRNGSLLERIYLDTESALLLERDQFDAGGDVLRTLAFQSLTIASAGPPPTDPPAPAHHAPKPVATDRMAPSTAAPATLADGYQRLGVYRDGGVVHVLYSDGLYDLSLFEQQGRLRPSDLPGPGERVAVGKAAGWRYPWPGGQVVVWSSAGKVFTAVTDAPTDQVLTAVRSLPPTPGRELSLLGKVRRACQALMEPLA
jgi:sigma-E factor negative regulatory protein RseB